MPKINPYDDPLNAAEASAPILEDLLPESQDLYIVFGGLSGGLSMPRFEFCRSLQITRNSKLFLRDCSQSWYQAGLPGIADDVSGLIHDLRRRIDELRPRRTVFLGNSMGGYAAILAASLLGTGKAIAFAPQTFISPLGRLRHRDGRWRRRVWKTYARCWRKRPIFDLRPIVSAASHTQIEIYVSRDDRLDMVHANHLADLPNVNLHTFADGGHGLVRQLRDDGRLHEVLRAA